MPQDLAFKIARLVGDYRALLVFIDFLEHELEKRIVARHCLTKLESLSSIAPVHKNELKRLAGAASVAKLEQMLQRLATDIAGGIRSARNAVIGHQLQLNLAEIPDQWQYLGRTTSLVLEQELIDIETEFAAVDSSYIPSTLPPHPNHAWLGLLSTPQSLGTPGEARLVHMPMGIWIPDLVAAVVQSQNEASIRVIGSRLMLRQIGLLLMPVINSNSVYERLLTELAVVDFFALEEAIYTGNPRGNTLSLVSTWLTINHSGAAMLQNSRGQLSPSVAHWRRDVRNKICAHIDPDIPATDLEMPKWPMVAGDFHLEVEKLCQFLASAAQSDIRTKYFLVPAIPQPGIQVPDRPDAPRWIKS